MVKKIETKDEDEEVEVEADVNDKEDEEVAKKDVKGGKNSVTVYWRGMERTYSLEEHGKEYKTLAESFATKFKGEIK